MIRKIVFALFMLIGVALAASCVSMPISPTPAANMPNPASVYCQQNGGKMEFRQDASGGVSGACTFPDGSECDEWTYFRGECKPGDSLAPAEPAAYPTPLSPSPTPGPSMLEVAYFGGGQIILWTEDKGSRRLAAAGNVEQVRISDDGQAIAYLGRNSSGGDEILAIDAGGANQRLLVGQDYLQAIQPAERVVAMDFAPASHTLYFVTERYDLHRVDADGGSPAQILEAGKGGFFSFSPDGLWMALYHPNELVLAQQDGSEARSVFRYPEDFQYTMIGPEIVWQSDSSGFNIASASGPLDSPDNMTVWWIPLVGEPVRQMTYSGPYGANLSPDGRTVVYLNHQHTPVDVHIVAADGTDVTYGSYANVGFVGWAPDAKHFLLNLSQDARLVLPYLCAPGEEPVQLTDTDDALPVVWVDAQRVLFASHGSALHLQRLGAPSVLVDADASSWFDYTYINP